MLHLIFFCLLFYALPAHSTELHLDPLLKATQEQHIGLKATRLNWKISQKKIPLAALLPNPQFNSGIKNVGIDGFSLGTEMMSGFSVTAMQEFPSLNKMKASRDLASKEATVHFWKYKQKEQKVLALVKSLYFEWFYTEQALKVNREMQILLKELLQSVQVKYAVGQISQHDVLKVQLEISQLFSKRQELLTQRDLIKNQLIQSTGHAYTLKGQPVLPSWRLPTFKKGISQLPQSTLRQLKQAQLKQAQQNTRLAMTKYDPDFNLSGGLNIRGPLAPIWEFKVGAKMPLYPYSRERLGQEKAELNQEMLSAQNDYEALFYTRQLEQFYLEAQHHTRQTKLYKKTLIPQAKATFDASLAGYLGRRVSFSMMLANFKTVLKYKESFYRSEAKAYQVFSQIQTLISTPVPRLGETP